MAERGSDAWRARVGEGTKRGLRPWNDGLKILPRAIRRFLVRHQLDEALRPIVHDVVRELGDLVEELGGYDQVSARQRAHLSSLMIARVAALAYFASALRNGDLAALSSAAPHVNASRSILQSLGIDKQEHPELDDYARALAAAGSNGEPRESEDSASGDRRSESDCGGEA